MYGKHQSDSCKKKISEAFIGRRYINNGIENKRVRIEDIPYWTERGYIIGLDQSLRKNPPKRKKRSSTTIEQ